MGLTLQEELIKRRVGVPVIVITGDADVALAVRAMKAGAVDFLEKPFADELLVESVKRALELGAEVRDQTSMTQTAKDRIDVLTEGERQVLAHVIDGQPNKIIAYELAISPRTVEVYRARVMDKLQARNLAELVRMAIIADFSLQPREK
jgi:two-component system response regulator FixJ